MWVGPSKVSEPREIRFASHRSGRNIGNGQQLSKYETRDLELDGNRVEHILANKIFRMWTYRYTKIRIKESEPFEEGYEYGRKMESVGWIWRELDRTEPTAALSGDVVRRWCSTLKQATHEWSWRKQMRRSERNNICVELSYTPLGFPWGRRRE